MKSATDPNSIENSLSAAVGQVTDFRGSKSDWWPILIMEIGSLNQPLRVGQQQSKTELETKLLGTTPLIDKMFQPGSNPVLKTKFHF